MRALVRIATALLRDRTAATAVEYGFIIALIILTMMVSLNALGDVTTSMWNNVSTKVQAAR